MKPTDITGKKFSRLTAVSFIRSIVQGKQQRHFWLFLCDCGNEAIMRKDVVVHGQALSCGCLGAEMLSARNQVRHVEAVAKPPPAATKPKPRPWPVLNTPLLATVLQPAQIPESLRSLPARRVAEKHPKYHSYGENHLPAGVSSLAYE